VWLRDYDSKQFEELEKLYSIDLVDKPMTYSFKPDFVTDYNTYRFTRTGSIVWYNNCAPASSLMSSPTTSFTPPPFTGVCQLQPLEIGIKVALPSFMHPRRGGNAPVAEQTTANFSEAAPTMIGSPFPVLFPFLRQDR